MCSRLIGTWRTSEEDQEGKKAYGEASITFQGDGKLVYTIIYDGKLSHMILTYEVQGNQLITDQPSYPQKWVTKFEFIGNDLVLYFFGVKSVYVKVQP